MRIVNSYGTPPFRPSSFCEPQLVWPSTQHDQASSHLLLHQQAHSLLAPHHPPAPPPQHAAALEPQLLDAEEFDKEDQLARWMQAQEEVLAVQEAEFFCLLEEEIELRLLELANEKDIKSHLMMKALRKGAIFLVDEESADKADYDSLVSIQQSAQKLLELVDRAMHAKVEEERRRAFNQVTLAHRRRREIEDKAALERGQLQSEINRLKQEYRDLHDLLEREKDRTTCRICFVRPRDVLPLPCTFKMRTALSFCERLWKSFEAFRRKVLKVARHPQQRVSDDTDLSKEFKNVRFTIMEEEAWPDVKKHILHQEGECVVQQVDALSLYPSLESELSDAEAFIRDDELACWLQAQNEVLAVQEAEFYCCLEEEMEQEFLELAYVKDIKSHLRMKSLHEGAMLLVDEDLMEKAKYQSLISIQQSAWKLLELVDQAIHAKEEEKWS